MKREHFEHVVNHFNFRKYGTINTKWIKEYEHINPINLRATLWGGGWCIGQDNTKYQLFINIQSCESAWNIIQHIKDTEVLFL